MSLDAMTVIIMDSNVKMGYYQSMSLRKPKNTLRYVQVCD